MRFFQPMLVTRLSRLCHFEVTVVFRPLIRDILDPHRGNAIMVESRHNASKIQTLQLEMAGIGLTFRTDSNRLAELASEFFPPADGDVQHQPQAALLIRVVSRRDALETNQGFPVFRGRNEYVHADYGCEGSLWFNLRSCAVSGSVSPELLADTGLFRRAVLAVIAGVLAPALGVIGIHAGCVVRDGRAVLLAAASGVGKSTLTLALAQRGWSLLSDDYTFINPSSAGLRAWGMQTSLKLLPDAVNHFPELAVICPDKTLNGEMAFEVDPWSFFHLTRSIHAQPTSVLLLERDEASFTASCLQISRCAANEVRTRLLSEIEELPTELCAASARQSSLLEQISALPTFRVRMGGPPGAVAAELCPILTERLNA